MNKKDRESASEQLFCLKGNFSFLETSLNNLSDVCVKADFNHIETRFNKLKQAIVPSKGKKLKA
jgi:hypothetical protein